MVHQGYINHVGLVLDASGSMSRLRDSTVKVADIQIQHLATQSKEVDQETRATVYQFDDRVECLFYDKDVLRLPSISKHYRIGGQTALIDATLKAIADLQKTATLYGDHAFLIYILTDGEENSSLSSVSDLRHMLMGLPDNWTLAVFVPDARGVHEAKKLGFAPGNISVWDPSERGIREVGETIQRTTAAYMTMRSTGARSTTGLFNLSTEALTPGTVSGILMEVPKYRYELYTVMWSNLEIKDFVERVTNQPYRKGSSFYELVKPEKIQASKQIAIRDIKTKHVYMGREARQMLGLPDYEVKVDSTNHPRYDIFVQSQSVNRKLVPGQEVLIFKQ